jgi:hypothetical protein
LKDNDAVMKTSNGIKGRKEDEQALLGKRECGGAVVVVVVVVGPARKKVRLLRSRTHGPIRRS